MSAPKLKLDRIALDALKKAELALVESHSWGCDSDTKECHCSVAIAWRAVLYAIGSYPETVEARRAEEER